MTTTLTKVLRAGSAAAAAMILTAGTAFADPLEGQWRTAADDNGNSGIINVAPCGSYLCGTLIRSFDAAGSEFASANLGRQIIFETVGTGPGTYEGKVYSPDRDAVYDSRLTLTGNQLSVEGCWLGFCRDGGTWARQ